ncbi:MAG: gamma carbonic anhydrase family protein [Acidobacteria bacterium]|nr:gamma carbonic anhydrase family protein [Acidobacteriota bacterium]
MIRSFRGISPKIAPTAFVDESAQLIGDIVVGEHVSIWPNAVIRADLSHVRIGDYTNIQDNCVLHVDSEIYPLLIGERVGIGHNVILHSCRIEPRCLIGMGTILLNNVQVGTGTIVAAGTVVPEHTVIPPGSLFMGVPGRLHRPLTEQDYERIDRNIANYARLKDQYLAERRSSG